MKKLNGMKSDFSSLENKKLKNMKSVIGGNATNERTQERTGPNGEPGNTGVQEFILTVKNMLICR